MNQKKQPELSLITDPPAEVESACLKLDTSIDTCVLALKEMRDATKFLMTVLDHPFQAEALKEIDALIHEAMIPYLDLIDQQFQDVAGS